MDLVKTKSRVIARTPVECALETRYTNLAIFSLFFSYENLDVDSATTWLLLNSSHYQFDEIHLLGSAHVAFKNPANSRAPISIDNQRMYGDKSGTWHVGYNQSFNINITDPDTPLSLRVYEHGELSLPRKSFLKSVSVIISGKVIMPTLSRLKFLSVIFNILRRLTNNEDY